jgi:predicted transcriptional regulator
MEHNLAADVKPVAMSDMPISPAQCRGARAMLGLDRADVAKLSLVHRNTITSFELGTRSPTRANVEAIQAALERAGAEFGADGSVRLRAQ